ncbi:MAG TPA: MlaD family protein [Thiobacillaceae bacterium]|nr:MlaD family protein [Thiobacillaceae bacterium]
MKYMHLKVGFFALAVLILCTAFLIYFLHGKGAFENRFKFKMAAVNADSVAPGVPITFSGIPIGQITGISLNDEGGIVISAEVSEQHAQWLRDDTSYVLDKPLVGSAHIRINNDTLASPRLKPGTMVLLLSADPGKDITVLLEQVKSLLANLNAMTAKESDINLTLANAKTLTGKMAGPNGVMEGILGTPEKAQVVNQSLKNVQNLTAKLEQISGRVDNLVLKTDQWMYAPGGVSEQAKDSLMQIRSMLNDAQSSLKKADALMKNAVDISANVKEGTQDIGLLRSEIDEAVRKSNELMNQINRILPGGRQPEVKLP